MNLSHLLFGREVNHGPKFHGRFGPTSMAAWKEGLGEGEGKRIPPDFESLTQESENRKHLQAPNRTWTGDSRP